MLRLVTVFEERAAGGAAGAVIGAFQVACCPTPLAGSRQILVRGLDIAQRNGIDADGVLIRAPTGGCAGSLVAEAAAWKADLIVLGTHGRGDARRGFSGGAAALVVGDSPVPVLLVRAVARARQGGARQVA